MRVSISHSEDLDTLDAITEVIRSSEAQLEGAAPQAGVLIASIEHDFGILLDAILTRWPDLELIGCTGDGEISSVAGAADDSVALMLFQSDRVAFRTGVGYRVSEDPERAVRQALTTAREGMDGSPSLCVIFPEGWGIDINAVLRTFQAELGPDTLVVGGMTSDAARTGPTREAWKGEVLQDAVPCMLFYGPLKLSTAVKSGMKPVGHTHTVTKAEGPYVRTIDDRPAAELWIHYFGQHSLFYPLAVFPEDDGQFYLSASPFQEPDGSAYFWSPIPEGSRVQLADVTQDELIAAAAEVCESAVSGYPGANPAAGLVFSCAGRKAMLGTRVGEEIDLLRKRLEGDLPLIGFYTNGELCPLSGQKTTRDHGYTFVTVLIGEE